MTQKEALEQALKDLGGRAHLQDIYPVALKYITHKEGSKIYDSLRGCIHDKRRFRPSPDKPQGWYELLSYQEELATLKKENEELKENNNVLRQYPKKQSLLKGSWTRLWTCINMTGKKLTRLESLCGL